VKRLLKKLYFYFCSLICFPEFLIAQGSGASSAPGGNSVQEVFNAGKNMISTTTNYTVDFVNAVFFFLSLICLLGGVTTFFLSKEKRKEALFLFGGMVVFATIGLLTTVWTTTPGGSS
jgi:hypothetical protein